MKLKNSLLAVFICALLLTILFYKQGIGLNLLIFDLLLITWLFVTKQFNFKNKLVIISVIGFLLTAIFTVVHYSILSYCIHFLAAFILVGILNYTSARSILTLYLMAWASSVMAVGAFFKKITKTSVKGNNLGAYLYKYI